MVIGGHYVVNGDRHDGLQVSCNSVRKIYKAAKYMEVYFCIHNVAGALSNIQAKYNILCGNSH